MIKALIDYTLKKAASSAILHSTLQTLFSSSQQVGFVFSERLINMPVQVVPPMYRMLSDEIRWAVEEASLFVLPILPRMTFEYVERTLYLLSLLIYHPNISFFSRRYVCHGRFGNDGTTCQTTQKKVCGTSVAECWW